MAGVRDPRLIDEFRTPRPIPGWRVVATGFVLAVYAWGLGFYGLSAYAQFLGAEGRWSLPLMSAATTVYFVLGSFAIGWSDRLARRFGRRRVAQAGAMCLAVGAASLPLAAHVPTLLLLYALMACGWAATSGTAITQIMGPWFERRRGLAVSLALTGASTAGVTMVPAMVWAIGAHGTWPGIAIVALVGLLPVLLLLHGHRDEPQVAGGPRSADDPQGADEQQDAGARPAPAAPETVRTGAPSALVATAGHRLRVTAVFAIGLFAQVAFLTLQLPILTPAIGAGAAATAVASTTASALAGRLLLGLVIDRLDHRKLLAACYASQVLGMFVLLLADGVVAVMAGCVLFGLAVGNLITLPAVVVQREFGTAEYGPMISRIWASSQFFYAFSPLAAAALIGATGTADAVIVGCAALQFAALLLSLRRH